MVFFCLFYGCFIQQKYTSYIIPIQNNIVDIAIENKIIIIFFLVLGYNINN